MSRRWMADRPVEEQNGSSAGRQGHPLLPKGGETATMTKAQEIFEKVEALVATGMSKADAFTKLAEEYGQPRNSLRGSYYAYSGGKVGKGSRVRRRETTPEDALADARATLENSIASIDREVEAAKTRAKEAAGEYEAIRGSAEERKTIIAERIEGLK